MGIKITVAGGEGGWGENFQTSNNYRHGCVRLIYITDVINIQCSI